MAHHVEPMDIDSSVCDFDDKENAFHHNNALPRTPCTEKGYEELDVSELNMKLRYSVTPAASPMSKSYAGNCFDNRSYENDNTIDGENGNMTRSLHTTLTKNDSINKTQKILPLQTLPSDLGQIGDGNRNVLQPLDSTVTVDNNVTVTVSGPNDIDDNISLPSSSSSMTHTPEATTPTKEIPKSDGGSPIIRGLKSVLNMFRPSQSPIPGEEDIAKLETLSPPIVHSPENSQDEKKEAVSSSTPLVGHKTKDLLTKRNSPNRESLVFNEDLEKELAWNDDSTILFSNEKIPIHKLFFQQPMSSGKKKTLDMTKPVNELRKHDQGQNLNASVEYMDISYNDSGIMDKTATTTRLLSDLNKSEVGNTESDSEFQDCESTFTKNESFKSQDDNELNSTEDVLSHINDLVEPKNLNVSLETLNASDAKSTDLSAASTETTKLNNSQHIATTSQEERKEDLTKKNQTENTTNEAILAVSDKIKIDNHVTGPLSNNVTLSNSIIENNAPILNSPVLENIGVKSLSQIPLLADPRILLFNIPSVTDNDNKNRDVTDKDLTTSPADIPLPEDDDIPSLPVMNSELENISHTLDKIAEEIPKINQHESSISSVGSVDTPTIENITSSEERETVEDQNTISNNLGLENAVCLGVEKCSDLKDHLKSVENCLANETLPGKASLPSETKSEVEITTLLADNSDVNKVPSGPVTLLENIVLPTETKSDVENIPLPASITKDVNVPSVILTETNAAVENMLPAETKSDVETIPLPAGITGDISVSVITTETNTKVENSLLPVVTKPDVESILLPTDIVKDFSVPVIIPSGTNTVVENTLLAALTKSDAENIPLTADLATKVDTLVENMVLIPDMSDNTNVAVNLPTEIEALVEKSLLPAVIKSAVENLAQEAEDTKLQVVTPMEIDTLLGSETKLEGENITPSASIEYIKVPAVPSADVEENVSPSESTLLPAESKPEVEDISLPSYSTEDTKIPHVTTTENQTPVENAALAEIPNNTEASDLPTTISENINMPLPISVDPSTDIDISVQSSIQNQQEHSHNLLLAERQQHKFKAQEVEPMDISMTDIQITVDKTQAGSKAVQLDDPSVVSNSFDNVETMPEKPNAEIIEIIKQEVESIVAKAVDIAMEKSNVLPQDSTTMEKTSEVNYIENNISGVIADIVVDVKNCVIDAFDQIEQKKPVNNNLKDLNERAVTCEGEATLQQISLNQLSDNKYSYTVQDNVPLKMIHHIASPTVAKNQELQFTNEALCKTETPVISNDPTVDVNKISSIKIPETTLEMSVDIHPESVIIEDKILEETPSDILKVDQLETADEEITVSENNSPFVSVSHEVDVVVEDKPIENLDNMDKSLTTKSNTIKSPPASPKIVSKGYNFNFDEIDDPFATKTKIRLSPAPDASPNQTFEKINVEQESPKKEGNKNYRRKSQPDRKRPAVNNKKMNSTFSGKPGTDKPNAAAVKATSPQKSAKIDAQPKDFTKENAQSLSRNDITSNDLKTELSHSDALDKTQEIPSHVSAESISIVSDTNKGTSSSEQSTYFSAGTSSDEAIVTKSETNVSDFDDPNFNPFASKFKIRQSPPPETAINPFATRSRICQTPPPNLDSEDPFATKCKIRASPENSTNVSKDAEMPASSKNDSLERVITDQSTENNELSAANMTVNIETKGKVNSVEDTVQIPEEKETAENISATTCSSNNDKESTVHEVNTEDEDTIEGPFLEPEDLQNYDKMSDFDGENVDMMQFSEPPGNDENPDAGELFIDAEAFEFLLNQNKANTVIDSGKESLFLKFDPLFAKRISSDGVMATLKQVQSQVKQSTPIKDKKSPIPRDATFDKSSPTAGPSSLNATQEVDLNSTAEDSCDDLNVTVSKPMMIVNPAVNPVVTPRNKTITPVRSNRHSLTFTSPAIAVIDRLLSMSSANNSILAPDTTVTEVHRDNEADLALTQLRELLADKEISVYNLRSETKELQNRLGTLESQMKSLENISEERLKKINELNEKLNEKAKINKNMAKVVEEYERTIASLIAETEQDKKRHAEERLQLIRERDEQTAHLASMEVSFSDLHSKYEKSKQVIMGFKANEDAYKKSIKEFEENLVKMQKNYELLKQHATSKLNHANEELQKINRAHEAEVLKMNAMIKRKEMHITSLEETLQQKTKANEELTAICDELINKVG